MSKIAGIIKEGIIAVLLSFLLFGVVLFPDVPRAIEQVHRMWEGYDRLAGYESTALKKFVDEAELSGLPPELFIDQRIKYASDFSVWNNFEYWENPEEVITQGRTDCEGKAILLKAVVGGLSKRRQLQVSSEVRQQTHHAYLEVKTSSNESGTPVNHTVHVYRIEEKPEQNWIEKTLAGFSGFVKEIPPVRQAMLAIGLFGIWGRYLLRVERLRRKS